MDWNRYFQGKKGWIDEYDLQPLLMQTLLKDEFATMPIPTKWLAPNETTQPLNQFALQVYKYCKFHHWSKLTIFLNLTGWTQTYLCARVGMIRDVDFALGFHGIQGRLDFDRNNCAGFDFVACPEETGGFTMNFFQDNSGPQVFQFTGTRDEWQQEVAKIKSSWWWPKENQWHDVSNERSIWPYIQKAKDFFIPRMQHFQCK